MKFESERNYILINIALMCILFVTTTKAQEYVAVAGDRINVRQSPDLNSKVLLQVNITDLVTVINISDDTINIGHKRGCWAYINVWNTKGWIFDYYLAYKNKLKKVTTWSIKEYSSCDGDYCPYYKFDKDGSFTKSSEICASDFCTEDQKREQCQEQGGELKKIPYGKGHIDMCEVNGNLYKYLRLIWAKEDKFENGGNEYLFFTESGKLCLYFDNCEN